MNQVIKGVGKDAPTVTNEKGGKQSQTLYRFDLLDPLAMFEMTKVLYEGAIKYGDDENWRKIPVREHLNHLLIHVYAYLAGDTSDDHLSHVMCRAMFAQAVDLEQTEVDDRPDVNMLLLENIELRKALKEANESINRVKDYARQLIPGVDLNA